MANKERLTRKEAAAHLSALGYEVTPSTLAKLGEDGPPYSRLRTRIVWYNRAELEVWAELNTERVGDALAKGALSAVTR